MLKFDLVCFCACVKRCVRWGHMFQEFMVLDPSFCSRKRVDFLFVEQWLIIMLRCLKKGPDIVCRFRRGQRAGWGNYGDSNIKGAMMLCPYVLVNQLCPTLCDPMDCSPPGSLVHGILRQEYWSALTFLSPVMNPGSPSLQADSLLSEPQGSPLLL